VQQLFGQGNLEVTGNSLDLAMSGNGFMVVRSANPNEGELLYTRAGQLTLDSQGYVSTLDGLRLQGYQAASDGTLTDTLGDLKVGDIASPPRASSVVDLRLNLDPDQAVLTAPWDPADPSGTSNYSTSVTLYDEQGNPIQADVYYRKTGDNQWEYHVLVDGDDIEGGTAGTPVEVTTGTLAFNPDGSLATHTPGAVSFTPDGPGIAQALTFGFDGSTQHAGESSLARLSQDGYAAGELRDVRIDADGLITGIFSNGDEQVLGQVAVANFVAPEGLSALSDNLWRATSQSGEAAIGKANDGGRGSVISGALEGSNVDLTYEFVKMIAAQRGFQASSRTIATADEMLSEVINLKR
jgi:flagellar hook protein FlgE